MHNRLGEECGWEGNPQADSDLDTLQSVLNCASLQGCDQCVPCSERALGLFRRAARVRASLS